MKKSWVKKNLKQKKQAGGQQGCRWRHPGAAHSQPVTWREQFLGQFISCLRTRGLRLEERWHVKEVGVCAVTKGSSLSIYVKHAPWVVSLLKDTGTISLLSKLAYNKLASSLQEGVFVSPCAGHPLFCIPALLLAAGHDHRWEWEQLL